MLMRMTSALQVVHVSTIRAQEWATDAKPMYISFPLQAFSSWMLSKTTAIADRFHHLRSCPIVNMLCLLLEHLQIMMQITQYFTFAIAPKSQIA